MNLEEAFRRGNAFSSKTEEWNDEDVFKILVTTDNHLGYMEKDPVRSEDTFKVFEEMLRIASKEQVDLILQAGDLFHENKPSLNSFYKTMSLLRKYCMGGRKSKVEILSSQEQPFSSQHGVANFLDPCYDVSIPLFIIHGNHDDPTGVNRLSALDVLSVSGLVNYFGKQQQVDDITIFPILLKKGCSLLALYGLGNIRDERLNNTFKKRNVKIVRPKERTEEWFNIFALHQNRFLHSGPSSYIPEDFLCDFLNIVIWGHEHECKIDPTHNSTKEFYVIQPGSSVATSMSKSESGEKHVCIIKIFKKSFTFEKHKLETPRSFVFKEINPEKECAGDSKNFTKFLQERVNEMILEAGRELPLLRLKVEYSDKYLPINPIIFGREFMGKVANPKDILSFNRKRNYTPEVSGIKELPTKRSKISTIEDLVTSYLNDEDLVMIPKFELCQAVKTFVEKKEKDSINDYLSSFLTRIRKKLGNMVIRDEYDYEFIKRQCILEKENILKSSITTGSEKLTSEELPTHKLPTPDLQEAKPSDVIKKTLSMPNRIPNLTQNGLEGVPIIKQFIANKPIESDEEEIKFSNFKNSVTLQ